MDSLFSHASNEPVDPTFNSSSRIAKVVVPIPLDQAFDGFTDGIHLWWPLELQSHFGVYGHLGFDDTALLEEDADGESMLWAEIESWDAPTLLTLRWYLGGDTLVPTRVTVAFTATGESETAVELVQDIGSSSASLASEPESYCDWPLILARYVRFMGGSVDLD